MMTLGNLICGFAAIHYAAKPLDSAGIGLRDWSAFTMACMLIFVGMFFDAIDGAVARLTRSTSDIGAQLDSLADIVTFGVAPAYLTIRLVSLYYLTDSSAASIISPDHDDAFGRLLWVIAALYVCCAALRLARFNAETPSADIQDHMTFRGLPSPGAAGCVASLILFHQAYIAELTYQWVARTTGLAMAFILLLCAFAMVSRLAYDHLINRHLRGHRSFADIVLLTVLLIMTIMFPEPVLSVGFTLYALSAPVRWMHRAWVHPLFSRS